MRISTRIMVAIVFVVAMSVTGIAMMVGYEMNRAFVNNFAVSSHAQLERLNAFTNTFLDTAISTLGLLSTSPLLDKNIAAIGSYVKNPEDLDDNANASSFERELVRRMQDVIATFPMIRSMFVANNAGGIVFASDISLSVNFDPRTRPWYIEAVEAGRTILTPAYTSTDGRLVCSIATPVMSSDNTRLGVAGLEITLEELVREIGNISIGKTGYVLVLDSFGQVVSAQSAWLGKNIENLPAEAREALDILQRVAWENGTREVSYDGKVWLAAAQKTERNWTLVMLQERREVFIAAMKIALSISVVGLVIFLSMLILARFVSRSIAKPVAILAQASQKVSDGDLKAIPADEKLFQGEIGLLHKSLKTMVVKLAELIATAHEKIKEAEEALALSKTSFTKAEASKNEAEQARREGVLQTAEDIGSAIGQLFTATEGLARELQQTESLTEAQRIRVDNTATAIEQMDSVVSEVAAGSVRTANIADQAYHAAQQGKLLVEDVVSSMGKIETQSLAMYESLEALTSQAESIDEIMNVISDIADQTNLLALNAAIEAARAGDAGRGFAVVADEVRKLAEKTMEATRQVNQAVISIQQNTQSNMNAMQEATTFVSQSAGVASQAGEALMRIETMVDSTANEIRSIASASEEQATTTTEINRSTQAVHQLMDEVAQATHSSNQAVAELSTLSQRLNDILQDLRKG